jgi:hypothetical protein
VGDTDPGNPTSLSGAIDFSANGGFFNPGSCTPSGGGCTVSFNLPSSPGTVMVTATYSGDTDHSNGSGTTSVQAF